MKRTFTALLLSGAMLCAMATPALASKAENTAQIIPIGVQEAPAMFDSAMTDSSLYYGIVTGLVRDEQGQLVQLKLSSESHGNYVMNLSSETVWIDVGGRCACDPSTLEVGERVYVAHSHASTFSLPPQSAAFAVMRNLPQDAGCPHYHVVQQAASREDGSLCVTVDNGGLYLSAGAFTSVSSYQGGGASLEDLVPGTAIMAWYDVVLESYPAQTSASHIMVLTARENQLPQEGCALTLELDGQSVDIQGRYENGTAMVPVAAVHLDIQQQLIYGATKIQGAVGMTGPQDYGAPAYIADPGVTWAPAQIFGMLGKTVTLEGTRIIIS